MLHIGHLLDRKTADLSGGEMQRVSIGRAIARRPRVFLMDGPLSNFDAKLRESLRVELKHLQKTRGVTTLFVTHDQIEALTMTDRFAVLSEGRISTTAPLPPTWHSLWAPPGSTWLRRCGRMGG